jgi:AcrR family transcriptional regulator
VDDRDEVAGHATHATGARRRVEVRREEILSATVDHVDRVGLSAVRVGDVADALGVSPALVFYHFGTKDELLASALEYAVDRDLRRLDRAAGRGSDPAERLRGVVRVYGPTGSAQGWRVWIDAWAVAQRDPEIRALIRRLDQRWCEAFRRILEEGVAEGVFSCPDLDATVARTSALLDGLSVACLVYRTVSRKQLRQWTLEAVATEVGLPQEWVAGGS